MKTKLSDVGRWTELYAGQGGIEQIKWIDQLIQFRANNTKEQIQVVHKATEEQAARTCVDKQAAHVADKERAARVDNV